LRLSCIMYSCVAFARATCVRATYHCARAACASAPRVVLTQHVPVLMLRHSEYCLSACNSLDACGVPPWSTNQPKEGQPPNHTTSLERATVAIDADVVASYFVVAVIAMPTRLNSHAVTCTNDLFGAVMVISQTRRPQMMKTVVAGQESQPILVLILRCWCYDNCSSSGRRRSSSSSRSNSSSRSSSRRYCCCCGSWDTWGNREIRFAHG